MNPLELIRFVEMTVPPAEQLQTLALMADAPNADFVAPVRLPVQNELPAFQLGDKGIGSELMHMDYGTPAPVLGQETIPIDPSIGELLTGEING